MNRLELEGKGAFLTVIKKKGVSASCSCRGMSSSHGRETVEQAVKVVDVSIELLRDGPDAASPRSDGLGSPVGSGVEDGMGAVRSADELLRAKDISPMASVSRRQVRQKWTMLESVDRSAQEENERHENHLRAGPKRNGLASSPQAFRENVVTAITRKLLLSQQACALLEQDNDRLEKALSTSDKFIEQSKRMRATPGQHSLEKALEDLEIQVEKQHAAENKSKDAVRLLFFGFPL